MIYSVKVKNKRIIDLLFNIAKEKNIEICENYYKVPNFWKYFTYRTEENHIVGSCDENGEKITLDEMIDVLEKSERIKFKLNNNYIAVIDNHRKKVIVGCQEFDFKVIKELAEKLK
jgi:uncharacterized secreted protein with C-terminal beta-propeller domain